MRLPGSKHSTRLDDLAHIIRGALQHVNSANKEHYLWLLLVACSLHKPQSLATHRSAQQAKLPQQED